MKFKPNINFIINIQLTMLYMQMQLVSIACQIEKQLLAYRSISNPSNLQFSSNYYN